jgi:predicted Zn-dependent protease
MMKSAITATATLLLLSISCPSSVPAVQQEANWRNRISYAEGAVAASDVVEEIIFGRAVAARLIGRYGLYENLQLMKYVNLVGQNLARGTNRSELEFHFAVLKGDDVMAFAVPGGYVFVTQGALRQMRDEAELAGVLARELEHIAEKTVVRELKIRGVEDAGISSLAQVIGGSTDPARVAFVRAVDKAMDMLLKNGYKQEDETKADEDAVLLCAMTGYDPLGLVRYIERTHGIKGRQAEVLDQTHPFYEDRIGWIKAFIMQEGIDSDNYNTYKRRFTENMDAMR